MIVVDAIVLEPVDEFRSFGRSCDAIDSLILMRISRRDTEVEKAVHAAYVMHMYSITTAKLMLQFDSGALGSERALG
jgi:hypothetical protein